MQPKGWNPGTVRAAAATLACLLALWASIASATATQAPGQVAAVQKPAESAAVVADEYRLQVGDVIEVKFFNNPELNEKIEVGPDGRISLQLVEPIVAVGLTRSELQKLVRDRYAAFLKAPEVSVLIRTFASQRIFVGGEVNSPGLFPLDVETTALQAVMRAGGFKNTARKTDVFLVRKGDASKPEVLRLQMDIEKGAKRGDLSLGPQLRPFDVIFVTKSRIAKVNQFVDQYIGQMLPLSMVQGFGFVALLWGQ